MVRKVEPRPFRQSLKKRRNKTERKLTTKKTNANSSFNLQSTSATISELPENYSTAKWERVLSCRKRTLMQKACDIENLTGCLVTLTVMSPSGDIWYYASNNKLKLQLLKSEIITSESARVTADSLKNQVLLPSRELSSNIEPSSPDPITIERYIPNSVNIASKTTSQKRSTTENSGTTSTTNKRTKSNMELNRDNNSSHEVIRPPLYTSAGVQKKNVSPKTGNGGTQSASRKSRELKKNLSSRNFATNDDIVGQRKTSSAQHFHGNISNQTTASSLNKLDATCVSSNQNRSQKFPTEHVSIPDNTIVLSVFSSSSSDSTSSDSDSESSGSGSSSSTSDDSSSSSSDTADNSAVITQSYQPSSTQSILQTKTTVTTIKDRKVNEILTPSGHKKSTPDSEITVTQPKPFVKVENHLNQEPLEKRNDNKERQMKSQHEKEDTQKGVITKKSENNNGLPFSKFTNANSANKKSKPIAWAEPIRHPEIETETNSTQPKSKWGKKWMNDFNNRSNNEMATNRFQSERSHSDPYTAHSWWHKYGKNDFNNRSSDKMAPSQSQSERSHSDPYSANSRWGNYRKNDFNNRSNDKTAPIQSQSERSYSDPYSANSRWGKYRKNDFNNQSNYKTAPSQSRPNRSSSDRYSGHSSREKYGNNVSNDQWNNKTASSLYHSNGSHSDPFSDERKKFPYSSTETSAFLDLFGNFSGFNDYSNHTSKHSPDNRNRNWLSSHGNRMYTKSHVDQQASSSLPVREGSVEKIFPKTRYFSHYVKR